MEDLTRVLMEGSWDLHIHTAPSHTDRRLDDIDALKMADDFGMAGIMIKNHYESTAGRAMLLNGRNLFRTRAVGGIVLNWPAGGINPYAAESCLKLGGRMVWMPTRDSANSLKFGNMPGDFFDRPGITIYDERGKIRREVMEVLDVVKNYNACIATGHLSAGESVDLCRAARKMEVKTVLTHPNWFRTLVPLGTQKELAELGVYVEKVYANIKEGTVTAEQMAFEMKTIGYDHVFMVTDRGQASEELPAVEFASFIRTMLKMGLSRDAVRQMTCEVPQLLLAE